MKVKSPRPINLKGTRKEAVLLLHSFTGTIRDVKPLAQNLIKRVIHVTHLIIRTWITTRSVYAIYCSRLVE